MSTVHPATTPTSPRSETGLRIAVAVLALLLVASGGMLACMHPPARPGHTVPAVRRRRRR